MTRPARCIHVARAVALLSAGTIVLAACSDRDASSLTGIRSPVAKLEPALTLAAQIDALIATIIPPAYRPNIQSWWDGIKRKVQYKDARVAQSLVDLTFIIQKLTPKLTPPAGQSQADAAAQLVLLMSLYVHSGPETQPPPPVTTESDAELALVSPASTVEQTVETPSEQAAVVFPPGAVTVPTIVVITRTDPAEFEAECSGPLPTSRCQYPQFYKFDVFPDVRLNTPAFVAVCHVTHGDHRLPLADHERFRLAHQRPADPAAYHPEGTIEGEIEILPLVRREGVTDCEEEERHDAMVPPGAGALERFAIHSRNAAGRAMRAVGRAVSPKSLYAIDRGGGGTVLMFSDFAVIDPQSVPDVYVAGYFAASMSNVSPGQSLDVHVNNVSNDGTGPAHALGNTIVLANNAGLTGEGVITLATLPPVSSLAPGGDLSFSHTVTIPAGTAPGTYWVGLRLDAANTVAELDEGNNSASVMVTVGDPFTVFCPEGPPGSHGDMQTAINATSPGGTVVICNGTHVFENVTVNKPLTIRAQNPGAATITGVQLGGGQSGIPIFRVNGVAEGTVTFDDISFAAVGGRGIIAEGIYDRVNINNVRVFSATGGPVSTIGVMSSLSSVPGARVEITNSSFTRLTIGVFAVGGETNVRSSHFANMGGGSMIYSGSTGPGGWGTTENSDFENCGVTGCFRILANSGHVGGGAIRIANNTISGTAGSPGDASTLGAITVLRSVLMPLHPVLIEDNEIQSSRTEGPADQPSGYEWTAGILIAEQPGGGVHVIRRNHIRSAFRAFDIGAEVNAHDNTVEDSYVGIRQNAVRTTSFNRNDFTGVTQWFLWQLGANFQCNWWGTNDAPPPGAIVQTFVPAEAYNPRATGPIANTANPCTVTPVDPPSTTHLFSFRTNGSGDVGGSAGALLSGASVLNGKLQLNGEGAFVQQSMRLIPPTGSFSVEFFARQAFPQTTFVEVISQGVSGSGFYLGHDPSRQIRVSDAWPNTGRIAPSDGNEHHYAMTYDEPTNTARLYLDGIETASRVGALARGSSGGNNTRFGRQFDPFGEYFAGELDNLGVHNSALSAADVARLASRQPDHACGAEGTIVSGGGTASNIVFENRSGESVRIEWLDFSGNRVLYATLGHGTGYVQGTFLTHPWIVTGIASGNCYGIWRPLAAGRIITILPMSVGGP